MYSILAINGSSDGGMFERFFGGVPGRAYWQQRAGMFGFSIMFGRSSAFLVFEQLIVARAGRII